MRPNGSNGGAAQRLAARQQLEQRQQSRARSGTFFGSAARAAPFGFTSAGGAM